MIYVGHQDHATALHAAMKADGLTPGDVVLTAGALDMAHVTFVSPVPLPSDVVWSVDGVEWLHLGWEGCEFFAVIGLPDTPTR